VNIKQYHKVLMYFKSNILLNPISLNARRPTARLLKIHMNITIYGTYLHKKLQNIDIVEHVLTYKIKVWIFNKWSISSYFLEYFKKTWPYNLSTSIIKFPKDALEMCPLSLLGVHIWQRDWLKALISALI
jgi:hypothetical protein